MANSNGWGDGAANNSIEWGQGANNAIAWGDSHAKSWAGATDIVGIDSDAQAFITAAAITDPTQQTAIDTLVKGMKADGLWTKMKAVYPFVGGTASAHKWNLKDPRDLDAAFRLVFNGGWTHSANGATPNGTNGYADTKFNPSLFTANHSTHLSYYSRTDANGLTLPTATDIGVAGLVGASYLPIIYFRSRSNNLFDVGFYNYGSSTNFNTANTNSTGLYIGNRTSNVVANSWKNGIKQATNTNTETQNITTVTKNVFLSSLNLDGTAVQFSNRQCAFSTIGDGLTDTEAANLYTRVQAFQTALSRQV